MMKRFAVVLAAGLLLFIAACSGGEDTEEKTRIYDTERTALEDAKKVEDMLLKADEQRQAEIKAIEEN